ncbi:MAG: amidohydrolase family protein [Bacteroidia bacterium]
MKKLFALIAAVSLVSLSTAQPVTFPRNGVYDERHIVYAFTNARIAIDAENVIEKGTMLVKDGKILDVGPAVPVPKGALVYDLKGKYIYPSFIDPYTAYGMPEVKRQPWTPGPKYDPYRKGPYGWNDALKPETNAVSMFTINADAAKELRDLGFGTVMTHNKDGISRGTAACVVLNTDNENNVVIKDRAAACYSFDKGSSRQEYPSSLMGAIALLRQTYYDAEWYRNAKAKTEYNLTLEAWNANQSMPQIFETSDKWNVLRADKIGDEFKVQYIFKGSGNEYQRMDEMKATGGSFILPLNFPMAFDVEDPYDAELIDYADLKHWELAPLNPFAFEKYNIPFSFTTSDLKDKKEFRSNLLKAIKYGLSPKAAFRALTTTPAQMLGISGLTGALKKGMLANFNIYSGDVFDENSIHYENWVCGTRYIINDYNAVDVRGAYTLTIGSKPSVKMNINGEVHKLKASFDKSDSSYSGLTVAVSGNNVSLSYNSKPDNGVIRLSGYIDAATKNMSGRGQTPAGNWFDWMAVQTSGYTAPAPKKDTAAKDLPTLDDVIYPFSAYGKPREKEKLIDKAKKYYNAILIKNVTVWTGVNDSIIPNTDVLMVDGRIVRIAKGIIPGKELFAKEIDGTGKHLTAGLIDEHSHIAISGGVNEGTQASSAEVRIGDVINPDDVNIYRQLAGGVVASQLLHGSANPIGGQSALIKLRWGANAEDMKIKGAQGFIKFALGENVKQTNWGEYYTIRFPQTRMGVEQVYYDYFTRATEYSAQMKGWQKLSPKDKTNVAAPRRDLELDALSEILDGTRSITCHSYIQSEINMLMTVADSMHFKVNTFTHILEGYKVADKMKEHGAGGSSFADWWAYKYEVKDAIPYNPAMLFRMGITTAINSDDAEMARRLNQESTKSMKYGGLTEAQAMSLCTSGPAKLLHLDKHMGTIEVNKDADVVLWSDNPTSVYAKVEMTIVDGKILYDTKEDVQLRETMKEDRARIVQQMIALKKEGAPVQRARMRTPRLWDCEDMSHMENYLDEE